MPPSYLSNKAGEVIQVKVGFGSDESLPLATIKNPVAGLSLDVLEGDTFMSSVSGIRLRSMSELKATPHFRVLHFNGQPNGDFVAIEIRRAKKMTFVSETHEVIAALRELGV